MRISITRCLIPDAEATTDPVDWFNRLVPGGILLGRRRGALDSPVQVEIHCPESV